VEVRSPGVLPPFVSSVSVSLEHDVAGDVELPPALYRATPGRQHQYLAGRYCAATASLRLSPSARTAVGRGPAGEPRWPAGIVGSVTHTADIARASVAWASHARSLGIDSEQRVDRERAERIKPLVVTAGEGEIGGPALDTATRVMLVFSAKEAIFKCLYPVVGKRFYYEDARILSADVSTGCFDAELTTTLAPGFERGTTLRGRFEIDDASVHTGVWLEPPRP
jgi:enterobactin synthetase component D